MITVSMALPVVISLASGGVVGGIIGYKVNNSRTEELELKIKVLNLEIEKLKKELMQSDIRAKEYEKEVKEYGERVKEYEKKIEELHKNIKLLNENHIKHMEQKEIQHNNTIEAMREEYRNVLRRMESRKESQGREEDMKPVIIDDIQRAVVQENSKVKSFFGKILNLEI